MKVEDLEGWPPRPSDAYEAGETAPTTQQAILTGAATEHRNWVTFTCSFGGKNHTYDFEAPDKAFALQLKEIVQENGGKSLSEIGNIEIPAD
jgi:hypothetical protein